ncbi:MAG: hypothetical protein ACTS9Y_07735 [Methylophilus sp.]|uniref:hypothetical protein n=1 Tax=Methylophilus sp. TaxID=29541 RepID=UPI003FA06903
MVLNQELNNRMADLNEYRLDTNKVVSIDLANPHPVDDLTDAEITFPDPTNPDPIDPDIINPAVVDPDDVIEPDGKIDPDEDVEPEIDPEGDPELPDSDQPDRKISHSSKGV